MAAEVLATAGRRVEVIDHRPSAARKFLMAGRGGLNLTHSEDIESFIGRYGEAAEWLAPMIRAFPPQALRDWCEGLGQKTFVGSSGRVFPESFKASPLLRAWQGRLASLNVRMTYGWRWTGWDDDGRARFAGPDGRVETRAPVALLLTLGGASWPRLGSDGAWTDILGARCVEIAPLVPANCGFTVAWTPHVAKLAGQPLKPLALTHEDRTVRGEAMVTAQGIEGGAVYALSGPVRDAIARDGETIVHLDLRPDLSLADLAARLGVPRGRETLTSILRKRAGLSPVALAVLRDAAADIATMDNQKLAAAIKAAPLRLTAPFAIERAISSAGGVRRSELDADMMLRSMPGVYVAGEMIDWEAPTGGYLLQASYATAVAAARGILRAGGINHA
jgi:hypothetical protein